jgi:hypothetical protein
MRFATSLFAALVLAGSLANAAQAQVPGVSKAAPGPYSVYGPGLTYRQDSGYTGPYSVYGPGLTYRQDSGYTGPYSAYGPGLTYRQDSGYTGPYSVYGPGLTYRQDSSYTGPYSVYGPGLTYRQHSSYTGPYSARLSSASSPAQTRTYSDSSLRTAGLITQSSVRISIAGNANQAIVIP